MKPEFIVGSEKRFAEFMGNLNEKDKIGILTHTDPDGICSAVIASKVLGKIDYLDFINYKHGIYAGIALELKKKKINKILIFDLGLDDEKEDIKEMEKFAEILVIDHHPFVFDLNSERTVFIKTASKYPATAACYYLFSKIQKIPSWIAAMGIMGDLPQLYFKDNCSSVFSDFGLENGCDLWDSVEEVSLALAYFEKDMKKIYDALMNAKNPFELGLKEYADKVKEDYKKSLEDYIKNREVHGDLIVYLAKSNYPIKSLLANKISSENQEKTIVFMIEYPDRISISARSQTVDCNKMMKLAVEGIPDAFAGGHKGATGGRVPVKYLPKFKKNLIRAYDNLKDKEK